MLYRGTLIAALAIVPLVSTAAAGSDQNNAQPTAPATPDPAVTAHEIRIGEDDLAFEARVEMLELTDEAGQVTAHLFTVAYVADDAEDDRPVTFLMNGGPGAASAYLHVGGVGPWVIDTDDQGLPTNKGRLVVNPDTWLDHTDLVFLDPVGTGFSRTVEPDDDRYFDRDADLDSLADAIDLWLDAQDRRASPVYLAGESYGGYRAAALPKRLMHDRGIALGGTILVSPVIDFATIRHHASRPMSWAFLLPSYAASAAGHDLAEPADAQALRTFALEDYLLALVHPDRMTALLPRLAELTGLDQDLLRERRGRVPTSDFTSRLLAEEDLAVSAYDGLITYPLPERERGRSRVDPVLDGMTPAYVTGILTLLREELDWPHGRDYRLLSRSVNRAWRYGSERSQGYVSAIRDLREVLSLDADFRVFGMHGETDLVTPWLATEWLFEQLEDALHLEDGRLVFARYPGGHMFYMRPDASAELAEDVGDFFTDD